MSKEANPTEPSIDHEASVAKSLFLGNIVEGNLFPFPTFNPDEADTLKMVLESVDRFMDGKDDDFREYDREGVQPADYVQSLRELGLFALIIPEQYGGIELSTSGYSRVIQQSSYYDASTSLTIGAHSSIGMKGLLLFGNEQQKTRYLPGLASGETIAAFCLTEPGSGSDAGSIKTKASKNPDGSWNLTGSKIWITNGAIADFFTVFAITDSENGKLSAFIVERAFEGVSIGSKEDKMGIRASSTTTVTFTDVTVPAENLLGQDGKGFKYAMSILNSGRTGLGGGCVGGMKRCLKMALRHSRERKQFGRSINEFRLVKGKLAQMAVDCFATESAVTVVSHLIDSGVKDYSVEAAISKVFASEAMWRVANEALQVAAGSGYMKEYPYERIVRDSRINLIFEGTNEILRLYIGLSGMKEAGGYLKELQSSIGNVFNDPIKGFGVMSDYAAKKLTALTSLGGDKLSHIPAALRAEAEIFEQYVVEFSSEVEGTLKKHGKGIIGKQFATKRLADTACDLFVGLCVLSRVSAMITATSAEQCQMEIKIAKMFSQQAKRRMAANLRRLERNEDTMVEELADFLTEKELYPWDVL